VTVHPHAVTFTARIQELLMNVATMIRTT